MIRNLILFLGLGFLSAAPLAAQTLLVRTLALHAGEFPEVSVKGPKEHTPLAFSAVQPGVPVVAVRAQVLNLYRSEISDEGEQVFVVAQKVRVPTGASSVILLAWSSDGATRYLAIDDGFGSARYNDWLLINTGKRPIAFQVGEKSRPLILKPATSADYRIDVEEDRGAAVIAKAKFNGETKMFYSTYWPVAKGKRSVVLFVDSGKKIRVKRITDKLLVPKEREGSPE